MPPRKPTPKGGGDSPIPPDALVLQPQPGPQQTFFTTSADIAIYGGAAGGG